MPGIDPNRTIAQNQIRREFRQSVPGAPATLGRASRRRTFVNDNPDAVQVDTATIAGSASGLIGFNVDGYPLRVTATGTANTDAAALAAAYNVDPFLYGRGTATVASAVVTVTGKTPGKSLVINGATASVTLANSATATLVADVKFGCVAIRTGFESGDEANELAVQATSSAMVARSVALTATRAAGAVYFVRFTPKDGSRALVIPTLAGADDNATAAAIVVNVDAALTAAGYQADSSAAANVVTIAATLAGYGFDVEAWTSGTASAALAVTADNGTDPRTWIDNMIAGFVTRRDDNGTTADTDDGYTFGRPFVAEDEGEFWTFDDGGTLNALSPVFVDVGAASATRGRCFTAAGTGRLKSRRLRWIRRSRTSTAWSGNPTFDDAIAVVQISPLPF